MAEGVFADLVQEAGLADHFYIDSAGTSSWHVGEKAHRGTRRALSNHGISYNGRSRQIDNSDLTSQWTYIIGMDQNNMSQLRSFFGDHPGLYRLLDFATQTEVRDVPDPYFNGKFESVYRMVEDGAAGLLKAIREREEI